MWLTGRAAGLEVHEQLGDLGNYVQPNLLPRCSSCRGRRLRREDFSVSSGPGGVNGNGTVGRQEFR